MLKNKNVQKHINTEKNVKIILYTYGKYSKSLVGFKELRN